MRTRPVGGVADTVVGLGAGDLRGHERGSDLGAAEVERQDGALDQSVHSADSTQAAARVMGRVAPSFLPAGTGRPRDSTRRAGDPARLGRSRLECQPPILNIFVPHTGQMPWVAGLPFFMVIFVASFISRFALHLTQ
jgi:hypothetical protein